ncbi:MAG: isocitrate lyase/phosphoenolpyruvate mutase family protein [Pseudomonadota bacterium]
MQNLTRSKNLKTLISSGLTIAPGVYDGMSSLLANKANFKAIYASGGAIARSTGRPDIGLLSLTEVVQRVREIVAVSNVPVIADADTGFGNELNVQRTVHEFENAGVAAIHIEDQTFPKRCGHLNNKTLIATEEMCKKILVASKSRTQEDFLIIARTDAIAVEGFSAAIDRAKAYAEVGADMIFVEAPESVAQVEQIAQQISKPKLINMFYGGKTPLIPASDLAAMGYRVAIIPSDLQRATIHAVEKTLNAIAKKGDSSEIADQLATFNAREVIVRTKAYFEDIKTMVGDGK